MRTRALRRRYGHSHAGVRSALLRARGDGATHAEPASHVRAGEGRLVFRPAGSKWQAAMVKRTSDGMWYTTPWDVAPFDGWLPDSAQTIDTAIRGAK